MESFFRYISYIEYYEEGKKKHTSGYVIWRYQNTCHHVEIHLKDSDLSSENLEIMEEKSGISLGEITVRQGMGEFCVDYSSYGEESYIVISGKKLFLTEIEGLKLPLEGKRCLYAKLTLPVKNREKKEERNEDTTLCESYEIKKELPKEKTSAEKENDAIMGQEEVGEIPQIWKKEERKIGQENEKEDRRTGQEGDGEEILLTEEEEKEEKEEKKEETLEVTFEKIKIIRPMEEQKWKQLCQTYPVVRPFPARQEFISVHPKDFIILQEGYQRLVHNSFLLHGYYNYGHLILGKLDYNMETPYYIGVPGVYYEREKRAARMFGFVGFECADQIIENGSFGYYMIEVKI